MAMRTTNPAVATLPRLLDIRYADHRLAYNLMRAECAPKANDKGIFIPDLNTLGIIDEATRLPKKGTEVCVLLVAKAHGWEGMLVADQGRVVAVEA